MILDGGECDIGVESTVISLDADGMGCTVLRPGEIIPRELCTVVKNVRVARAVTDPSAAGDRPQSPGMKYKHYAPASELILLDGDRESFAKYVNADSRRCIVLSYSGQGGDFANAVVLDIGRRGRRPYSDETTVFASARYRRAGCGRYIRASAAAD